MSVDGDQVLCAAEAKHRPVEVLRSCDCATCAQSCTRVSLAPLADTCPALGQGASRIRRMEDLLHVGINKATLQPHAQDARMQYILVGRELQEIIQDPVLICTRR